jgi:transcriptional regulator with XRE-family HTH domain
VSQTPSMPDQLDAPFQEATFSSLQRQALLAKRWLECLYAPGMDVKKWVRDARSSKGLSQEKLGEAMSRTKANIGHWETGKHEPSIDQLEQISLITEFPLPPLGFQGNGAAQAKTDGPTTLVPSKLGVQYLAARLGDLLAGLDATDKKQAAAILHDLALSPETAQIMAGKLERLLGEPESSEGDLKAAGSSM